MQKGKKLKIKVKHLVYIAMVIFIVIPNMIIGIASIVHKKDYENNKIVTEVPKGYYLQGLLNLYVNMPKISPFEDMAYYYMGVNEYQYNRDNVYYTAEMGMGMENGLKNNEGAKKAIEYHEKGIDGKVGSEYYMKNSFALASLYYKEGQVDKAFEIVNNLKQADDAMAKTYGYFNEGILNYKLSRYDEAIKSFGEMDETIIKMKNGYIGDSYLAKGDEKTAREYYVNNTSSWIRNVGDDYIINDVDFLHKKNDHNNSKMSQYYSGDDSEAITKMNTKILERYKKNIVDDKYKGNIKGKFIFNDIPMIGTTVVLSKDKAQFDAIGGLYLSTGEQPEYYVYVDENGEFEFNNIIEGNYSINLLIPKNKFFEAGIDNPMMEGSIVNVERGKDVNIEILKSDEVIKSQVVTGGELIDVEYNSGLVLKSDNIDYENVTDYSGVYPRIDGERVILEVAEEGTGEDIPYELGKMLTIYKDDEELEFYKMMSAPSGNYTIEGMYIGHTFEKEPEDDKQTTSRYNSNIFGQFDLTSEELKVEYPKEIIDVLVKVIPGKIASGNTYDYAKVLDYYEKAYEEDSENEETILMLIKLYTTGTDRSKSNRDVNKAIELSDKLNKKNNNRFLDWQVKEFIYVNYISNPSWSVNY